MSVAYDSELVHNSSYEFNSYVDYRICDALFSCGVFTQFTEEDVKAVVQDPIANYDLAIRIANYVYNKSGIVAGAIDYMVALPCLDRIITFKSDTPTAEGRKNKELMRSVLATIDDKHFIRDALFTMMNNGICFYYLETREKPADRQKYFSDWVVDDIVDINEAGLNASIITLPWKYTKIIGKLNGRYVLAFNLDYINEVFGKDREMRLRDLPQEIRDAYHEYTTHVTDGRWYKLDPAKTICRKIKSRDNEQWGRPLAIGALSDILYQDKFVDTKRHVLNNINHDLFIHEFPEGETKGQSSLTKEGQRTQHEQVRSAILNKDTQEGTSVVSVASGTKITHITNDAVDIFDETNEGDLNNTIALDMGICASLLGAMSTGGNYSAQVNNLQMVTSQVYEFVADIARELNYVINANIIRGRNKAAVEVYYFPTSFVNRNEFFGQMKSLYTDAGGSLQFLVAAAGIDPDTYISVLKSEYQSGLFDMIQPHQTSYTLSSNSGDSVGRPRIDQPTNDSTIRSRTNGTDLGE